MKRVVIVGSINADLVTGLDRWPGVGETVTATGFKRNLGGKGANQCVAVARLGCPVAMVGAVGSDGFGRFLEAELAKEGIDLQLMRAADVATGMAFIDVVPSGENIIRLVRGANAALGPGEIDQMAEVFSDAAVVLLQNEIPIETSLAAARLGRAAGATIVMDPAPAPVPFWDVSILTAFDVLTPNALEVKHIFGTEPLTLDDALEAAHDLRGLGLQGAVVTMGRKGVAWSAPGTSGKLPAQSVTSVDTVAAGDCFNGALAAAITERRRFDQAVAFAAKAAAISTTRPGAAESAPTRAEVNALDRPAQTDLIAGE